MSMAANAMPLPSGPVRSSTERRGILFIISAPSGTGKTTLCKQLAANISGLWHSVSYTTRKPRTGEEHGREYFFTDEATFQASLKELQLAQAEAAKLRFLNELGVRKILTPDQLARFRELRRKFAPPQDGQGPAPDDKNGVQGPQRRPGQDRP